VRALRLARLDAEACQHLLEEKDVAGSTSEQLRLVEAYAGNPLALKIVARTIVEIFGGQIAPSWSRARWSSAGFARLSAVEQSVLLWLAILREPVNLQELLAVLGAPLPQPQVLKAIDGLRGRSLIEQGLRQGSFTLQSVVMEYVTARLIAEVTSEIKQGRCSRLVEHGLELAPCKEYVRQTQQRLIVAPILAGLRNSYSLRTALEGQLFALLDELRERADDAQGYGPANLLVLLRELRGHLCGLDLSHLLLRSSYVQEVEMQDTALAGATLHETVFTESFDPPWSVATSSNGRYCAMGSRRGGTRVWRDGRKILNLTWQAHTAAVQALAFSPDEQTLATGSSDGTIKLWNLENGALLWLGQHGGSIHRLVFTPDGRTLVSGGDDAAIRLWDIFTGKHLQTLSGQSSAVYALACSPDGSLLASGSRDQVIWLWDVKRGSYRTALHGHTAIVHDLAFTPDSRSLLSGSEDGTIRVWDVERGQCTRVNQGYTVTLYDVAWNPGGTRLASAGSDMLVTIWECDGRTPPRLLRGHSWIAYGVAWSADGQRLSSSGLDNAIQVWDAITEAGVQILRDPKHPDTSFFGVEWSPDGRFLASGSYSAGVEGEHEHPPLAEPWAANHDPSSGVESRWDAPGQWWRGSR
jgi:WD40 repeat protein